MANKGCLVTSLVFASLSCAIFVIAEIEIDNN